MAKYAWITKEFVNPYAEKLKKWKAGSRDSDSINYNYYSRGKGYQEFYKSFIERESVDTAKKLGIRVSQLLTNPQLYSDPEALAKYTGRTYKGTSYAPGTEAWRKIQDSSSSYHPDFDKTKSVIPKSKDKKTSDQVLAESKEAYKKGQYLLSSPAGESAFEADGTTPKWLTENIKGFSQEDQEDFKSYYDIVSSQDEEDQERLIQALNEAKAGADPYFAEKIRMVQDELTRSLGRQKGDFASRQRDIQLRIDQIKEDMISGKERLSIDKQAELGRQQRRYEQELENLTETARHAGLTFSSRRALAEGKLQTEQTDIVESTKRSFQRRIKDLQQSALRGETEAQNLLEDYEKTYGENITNLVRTAERSLGTKNLPSLPALPGVAPLGGVVGTLAEEKERDIARRAESLLNPF